MVAITFKARRVREKRELFGEDVNEYEVRYNPTRGIVHGTLGDFSNLLLEAVCGMPEHNPRKEPVRVSLQGDFPQKYEVEIRRVFDFYARAEDVKIDYLTQWNFIFL